MDFKEMRKIDVSKHVEKKKTGSTELSYLSWAYAFDFLGTYHEDWSYEIKMFPNENGVMMPYVYDENTGYMVFTEITIEGNTKAMFLPVMDGANKAMKNKPYTYSTKYGEKTVEQATMFDINKTIMRCLVKNLAMFGLGLSLYAGEDLPIETEEMKQINNEKKQKLYDEIDKIEDMDTLKAFYMAHKKETADKEVQQYLDAQAKRIIAKNKKHVA